MPLTPWRRTKAAAIAAAGYPALLFLMFLENVFPPIPSELILNFHALITRAARDQIQIIIAQDDEVRRLLDAGRTQCLDAHQRILAAADR